MSNFDLEWSSEAVKELTGQIKDGSNQKQSGFGFVELAMPGEPMDSAANRNWDRSLSLINRLGLGYVVFDDRKSVIDWNAKAITMLDIQNDEKGLSDRLTAAFGRLTLSVQCKLVPNTLTWVVIAYRGGTPVVMHEKTNFVPPDRNIVLLLDRYTRPHPNPSRLKHMFGLTNAETEVLINIARGNTLLEIAKNQNLSRATIRSHLASLFAKTETRRQSELISLIDSFAILP